MFIDGTNILKRLSTTISLIQSLHLGITCTPRVSKGIEYNKA